MNPKGKSSDHYLGMLLTEIMITFIYLSLIMGMKYYNGAKDL